MKLTLCQGARLIGNPVKRNGNEEVMVQTNCEVETHDFQDGNNSFLITQRQNWMYVKKFMAVQYESPTRFVKLK